MQIYSFSDLEGLRIAAEMEKRGATFYERAARVSPSEEARTLLMALAADEKVHRSEFNRLYERALERREEEEYEQYDEATNAYLTALAADIVFPGGLSQLARDGGLESPEAILRTAIKSEEDSIAFYEAVARVSKDAATRAVFEGIAAQERVHKDKLTAMKEAL